MQEKKKRHGVAAGAGVLGLLGAILLKFKAAVLGALQALPLLKLGWLLKGSWTMLVSLGLYTVAFGWRYAVTIVVLIFIHEMGHYLFMRAKGLNPKLPVFVPFLGAYTAMSNLPKDPATHAWVALAGPLVGGLGAFVMYLIGDAYGHKALVAAASTGFLLNLLQLVPVRPFDGGFISECISRWLSVVGVIALLFVAFGWHSVFLTVIAVVCLISTIARLPAGTVYQEPEVGAVQRAMVTLAYFGLAVALGFYFRQSEQALCYLHAK